MTSTSDANAGTDVGTGTDARGETAGGRSGSSSPARLTLAVILASATLTVMAGAVIGPVVRQIGIGVGVSGSLAGLIITTHGVVIVVASPLAGALIDRVGPRRPYLLGLGLYGVGGGAGLVVDSFGALLASRVVLGVGVALVYTGVTVLIYTLYRGRRMDRALGLRSSANSLGAAVWPLVGGALGTVSWHAPFGVYLAALPLGLVALVAIPATDRGTAGRRGATDTRPGLGKQVRELLAVFRRLPAIPAVYLLYFGANLFLYVVVVYYPQLLAELGVTSTLSVGLYLAANGAASAVTAAAYDRLVGRFGRHRLVLAAFGLWVAGFGVAAAAGGPLAAGGPVLALGVGTGLVFPSAFAWVEALAPRDRQGSLASYIASAGYLGQFLSPLAFGLVVPVAGVRGVFGAAALAAGVGGVVLGVGLAVRGRGADEPVPESG
ncbi:MAG: MFS transporter [Haloarculaceae archaeon]